MMEDITLNKKEGKVSPNFDKYKAWAVFVVFIMTFAIGVIMLYFWWLDPWIRGVEHDDREAYVPGVESTDNDNDGLNLRQESKYGTSDNLKDSDNDGLDDNVEIDLGTDPVDGDTDGDGYLDGAEIEAGYDPFK